jgi:hypothetical protein
MTSIHVMPNVQKFLSKLDNYWEANETEVVDGVEYIKYWYTDDNGLYQYVYDYA